MPTTDRDPVVARALEAVQAPPHRAGFWEELDARVDEPDGPSVPDSSISPLGRGRRPRAAALLAAAAVVVVVAGAVVLSSGRGPEVLTTTPADELPASTTVATAPPGDVGARGEPTPDGAVRAWIAAVAAGDVDRGARLVGPRTHAYMEALGTDVRGLVVEAGEGYGAWVDSPDMSTTEVALGEVAGVDLTVVVISGTWTGEGGPGFVTEAVPVARSGAGGTWLVEPSAFDPDRGGRMQLVSPAPDESGLSGTTPDAALEALAPGAGTFYFSLDDGAVAAVEGVPSGPAVRARWDPPGEMASRTHLLVVAYVDGRTFTAFAGTFAVEG